MEEALKESIDYLKAIKIKPF